MAHPLTPLRALPEVRRPSIGLHRVVPRFLRRAVNTITHRYLRLDPRTRVPRPSIMVMVVLKHIIKLSTTTTRITAITRPP